MRYIAIYLGQYAYPEMTMAFNYEDSAIEWCVAHANSKGRTIHSDLTSRDGKSFQLLTEGESYNSYVIMPEGQEFPI